MLPGFRFLFGAIVLCFSILVFGLGAAALFRAAHEEFATRPSWRGTPGTMLAQQNEPFAQQSDPSRAVLALLEVEPNDKDAAKETSDGSAQEPGLQPSASEATAAVTEPAAGNLVDAPKPAALSAPEEPSPAAAGETAKDTPTKNTPTAPEPETVAHLAPEMSPGDGSAAVERAAPPAVTSEPAAPVASLDETASKTVEPSTTAPEPINLPAAGPQSAVPAPQIAALGLAETADVQAREKEAGNEIRAKAYRNFIKNRLRAQRAAKARHRLAHRARIVRRAAVQQRPAAAFTGIPATPPGPVTTNVPVMTNVPAAENPYRF
jgi:hypothetical protein